MFGVPSIRDDIKAPHQPSVSCLQNYGDEPRAQEVLFPHGYNHYGLSESDLVQKRNRKDIQDIFRTIGVDYRAGKFEGVWLRACEIEKTSRGADSDACISVLSFLQAVKEMDSM